MRVLLKHQKGYQLFEILIVLVMSSLLIILGVYQYQQYRVSAALIQAESDATILLNSMSNYFRANCQSSDFNPAVNPSVVALNTLSSNGYFTSTLTTNLVLDNSTTGIVLQFNPVTTDTTVYQKSYDPANPATPVQKKIGSVVLWRSQVAMKFRPSYSYQDVVAYATRANATCVSVPSGLNIVPCQYPPVPPPPPPPPPALPYTYYMVWDSAPSSIRDVQQGYDWVNLQIANQFKMNMGNQIYSNSQLATDAADASNVIYHNKQYFRCN